MKERMLKCRMCGRMMGRFFIYERAGEPQADQYRISIRCSSRRCHRTNQFSGFYFENNKGEMKNTL